MDTSRPVSSREALLEAALRVAHREGMLSLTLERVAAEAGVTKGGLLYHFRSKDELIQALVEHFGKRLEQALIQRVANDPNPRGRWVRSMVNIVFPDNPGSDPVDNEISQFSTVLMAAALNNPKAIEPMLPLAQRVRERIMAEEDNGADQLLLWLAVDGMYLWQVFGLMQPDDPTRLALIREIKRRVSADRASGGIA